MGVFNKTKSRSESHSVDSQATAHYGNVSSATTAEKDQGAHHRGSFSEKDVVYNNNNGHDDTGYRDDMSNDVDKSTDSATPAQRKIDPEVEKRLLRKLDRHLPWLVAFLFLLSFLDRSNIGNAKIAGMQEDLGLVGNDRYDWLLTIFYISYIIFQFQAFMWRIMKPHQWAGIIVMAWGILATCQAAAQSWGGMMALRFLLGAAEAGFGPSVPFLLSFFYLRHEIGFRSGLFLSAAPLANTFAGALAYGITSGHPKLAKWRLLFLVEGIPTIIAAALAWFFLPDGPSQAKFLTEEEKEVARLRTARSHGKKDVDTVQGKVDFREIGQTLMDAKAWFTALMYFSCNVSYASLPVFLPTVLEEMGFKGPSAQGLTAPPYFLSFLVTVGSSYVADRTQQRGLMVTSLSIIAGVGYIMLVTLKSTGGRYAGVFLAAAGVFPAIGNILPWVVNNQGSTTRRGMGIVLLNVVGQCGPLLGTRMFPSGEGPFYIKGQAVCAAFMFFNALLAMGLRTLLVWENKKLDAKYGPVGKTLGAATNSELEAKRAEMGGVENEDGDDDDDEGNENYGRNYRYVL